MGKRQSSSGGGMNLDSLMDTLTNVVGILLIILIFAVLGGADTVRKIKGFVDEINEQQLAEAAQENTELEKLLEQLRKEWDQLEAEAASRTLSTEEQNKLIEQLKADMKALESQKIDPEEIAKQVAERKERVAKLSEEVKAKLAAIDSLKARLAEPAQGGGAETKVVNLPDPREAPKGATAVVFLCTNGRVIPVDRPKLQGAAQKLFLARRQALLKQGQVDCEKLIDHFNKQFVGDRFCEVKVRVGGDAKPYLAVKPREDVGELADGISRPGSQFNGWIRGLDPQKNWIEFRVNPDGFQAYLEARNAVAKRGLLAGWVPVNTGGEYWIPFGQDFQLTCYGKEPPKPAPPRDPNKPPPPADQVD